MKKHEMSSGKNEDGNHNNCTYFSSCTLFLTNIDKNI